MRAEAAKTKQPNNRSWLRTSWEEWLLLFQTVTPAEMALLRNAPKDAAMAGLGWIDVYRHGAVVRRFITPIAVTCPGQPASVAEVYIEGDWWADDDIQIRLTVRQVAKRRQEIAARVCVNHQHAAVPHWHLPDKPGGDWPRVEIVATYGTPTFEGLLFDVFVPQLSISNFQRRATA